MRISATKVKMCGAALVSSAYDRHFLKLPHTVHTTALAARFFF